MNGTTLDEKLLAEIVVLWDDDAIFAVGFDLADFGVMGSHELLQNAELAPRCALLFAHLLRVKSNAKAIFLHEKEGRLALAVLACDACWPNGGIAVLRALLAVAQADRRTKSRKLRQAMVEAKIPDGLRDTMRRHHDHMLVVQVDWGKGRVAGCPPRLA